jgi:hypothetical protein
MLGYTRCEPYFRMKLDYTRCEPYFRMKLDYTRCEPYFRMKLVYSRSEPYISRSGKRSNPSTSVRKEQPNNHCKTRQTAPDLHFVLCHVGNISLPLRRRQYHKFRSLLSAPSFQQWWFFYVATTLAMRDRFEGHICTFIRKTSDSHLQSQGVGEAVITRVAMAQAGLAFTTTSYKANDLTTQ